LIVITTQCFPPDTGGIEGFVHGLAESFSTLGRDVTVLADAAGPDGDAFDAGQSFQVRRFAGPKILRRFLKAQAISALLRTGEIEAIVADSWKSVERLTLPRGPERPPLLCLAHGMEFPAEAKPGKRARIARSLAKADIVSAVSTPTADRLRPYLEKPETLRIQPPGIFPARPPDASASAQVDTLVGERRPVLLTVGRLEPRKGHDMVIRATAPLGRDHPGLVYVIAGSGPDRPRLETLAQELGVADRVVFAGRVSEDVRNALFKRADLLAMPVRVEGASVEGFGLVYLEAALAGTPALAGLDGGAREAVLDGETGVLCDGADPAAVETALRTLLQEDALRARLGEAAETRVRGSYLWPSAARPFLTALRTQRDLIEASGG
jgi:phosphatidylinositol alpha-1,6-mannosyltransferase